MKPLACAVATLLLAACALAAYYPNTHMPLRTWTSIEVGDVFDGSELGFEPQVEPAASLAEALEPRCYSVYLYSAF